MQVASASAYMLQESYVGPDFFSKWDFFTGEDPTHGAVEYVDYEAAIGLGLARAAEDRVFMGVDMATVLSGGGRRSIRIESKATYNGGLFVISLDHVPAGCGSWPAFWMYGSSPLHQWPEWGEFDIIESVHRASEVVSTLHTTQGCSQASVEPGSDFTGRWDRGRSVPEANDCWINAPGQFEMQGCVQKGPKASIGAGFNEQGGGTVAAEWDPGGERFRTWFWPLGAVPADLLARRPLPDSWGTPYSYFSLSPRDCPASHFLNMRMVFDVTFCGDLGGPRWSDSCPELAADMTCEEFVLGNPEMMADVYWSIRVLDTYLLASALAGPGGWLSRKVLVVVLCLLLALTGCGCYVLERLRDPQDPFPGPLRNQAPSFWEALTSVAMRVNPSCLLKQVCALAAGMHLAPRGAWEALPSQASLASGQALKRGDPVIVRTPFVATGKYFGQKPLAPNTPGVIEDLMHNGAVVIRFAHFWGTCIVSPEQFCHLDTPTEEEVEMLHASAFSKRGKAVVTL